MRHTPTQNVGEYPPRALILQVKVHDPLSYEVIFFLPPDVGVAVLVCLRYLLNTRVIIFTPRQNKIKLIKSGENRANLLIRSLHRC